ncbi:MAG: type II secretion system protein GspG [Oceanidesulfovibrio sp.]
MHSLFTKLLPLALTLGLVAGNAEDIERFYHELVAQTQYVVSGMDMRNIGMMLDYEYVRTGSYPDAAHFQTWMRETFKENNFRELARDAWGTPLDYSTSARGKTFRLVSAGSDTEFGTDDDLVYTGP